MVEQEVTDDDDDGFIHEAVTQEPTERRTQQLLANEGIQRERQRLKNRTMR